MAKRLALFTNPEGTVLKDLAKKDSVIVKFKLNSLGSNATPLDSKLEPRLHGYLPGGFTGGGSREWLVNANAGKEGLVDMATVIIEEIVK